MELGLLAKNVPGIGFLTKDNHGIGFVNKRCFMNWVGLQKMYQVFLLFTKRLFKD